MPRLARIAVVCLAGLGLAGCGESRTEADEGIRIGMMPKLMGISFFDVVRDGATQAAGELGVKLTFDGPTVDSSEEQAEMIDAECAAQLACRGTEFHGEAVRRFLAKEPRLYDWDAMSRNEAAD